MTQAAPPPATASSVSTSSTAPKIFLLLSTFFLATLLIQLPRVADFEKFAFYDEGAWLHLDQLFATGKMPATDIGYSYGMFPLILSRAWFALTGRTPWSFIAFLTLCNLWTTWNFASLLAATQSKIENQKSKIDRWLPLVLAAIFLPFAILPNNYSLMHPLEMALLTASLAQFARGRVGGALAFATLAVFTKPTLAYVLGLLLLIAGAWLRKSWRILIAPTLTALAIILLELATVGIAPLLANLLPLKGGNSYRAMNFGIFRAGKSFWYPHSTNHSDLLNQYLFGPAGFWIAATILTWIFGAKALANLMVGPSKAAPDPAIENRKSKIENPTALLLILAILHTTFIFVFYAWSGSWTYYSYLPVLALLIAIPAIKSPALQKTLAILLILIAALGLKERLGDGISRWMGMTRPPNTAGLWVYPELYTEAQQARQIARDIGTDKTLFLINGDLPQIWPDVRTPQVWFLSPNIQTEAELKSIHEQIAQSNAIVLCKFYDPLQEAWNWNEFAADRAQFETKWEGPKYFRILTRKSAAK